MTVATLLHDLDHDFYKDPVTLGIARTTDLATIVRQRIKCRIQTVRGEWGQDPEIGVPLFDKVLVKDPDLVALQHLFVTEISKVQDVQKVVSLDLSFTRADRDLQVYFAVVCSNGDIAEGGV